MQFIDISKAAGIDKISGRFLKDGANILAKPIAKICNISISSGLFPSDCKIAKLKPLYKKGSKTNPENFRPISVTERIVYDQVDNFLLQNNICTIIIQDLGKITPPTSASLSLMIKY